MTRRFPFLAYASPRKLPKAKDLPGRVVVLDIAFAAGTGGASFAKTTKPFLDALGARLAMWIDHHDHVSHADFAGDPRFVLATKAEHGACPELITPELVERAGLVDSIVCHTDFDGLCCAAKWIRGGVEPYAGADADARAIDTRLGVASERAAVIDRAIRARPREDGLRGLIVRFLAGGTEDGGLWAELRHIAEEVRALEDEARRLSRGYVVEHDLAVIDTRGIAGSSYDKTLLLMLGQERARISVVHDDASVTAAARFDSGVDLLALLGIEGGMPTRVSVAASRLDEVLLKLRGV
jgi:hypothetical protein